MVGARGNRREERTLGTDAKHELCEIEAVRSLDVHGPRHRPTRPPASPYLHGLKAGGGEIGAGACYF